MKQWKCALWARWIGEVCLQFCNDYHFPSENLSPWQIHCSQKDRLQMFGWMEIDYKKVAVWFLSMNEAADVFV